MCLTRNYNVCRKKDINGLISFPFPYPWSDEQRTHFHKFSNTKRVLRMTSFCCVLFPLFQHFFLLPLPFRNGILGMPSCGLGNYNFIVEHNYANVFWPMMLNGCRSRDSHLNLLSMLPNN